MNGAVVVARWSGQQWLVARGVVNGRHRVDLNLYPMPLKFGNTSYGSGYWTGDGAALLKNALLYR